MGAPKWCTLNLVCITFDHHSRELLLIILTIITLCVYVYIYIYYIYIYIKNKPPMQVKLTFSEIYRFCIMFRVFRKRRFTCMGAQLACFFIFLFVFLLFLCFWGHLENRPLEGTPCPVGAAGGYPVCPVRVILCLCTSSGKWYVDT